MTFARFHLGDGRADDGTSLMSTEALRSMQEPEVPAEGSAHAGIGWQVREVAGTPRALSRRGLEGPAGTADARSRSRASPSPRSRTATEHVPRTMRSRPGACADISVRRTPSPSPWSATTIAWTPWSAATACPARRSGSREGEPAGHRVSGGIGRRRGSRTRTTGGAHDRRAHRRARRSVQGHHGRLPDGTRRPRGVGSIGWAGVSARFIGSRRSSQGADVRTRPSTDRTGCAETDL